MKNIGISNPMSGSTQGPENEDVITKVGVDFASRVLSRTVANSPYYFRRATSESDLHAAQALRFLVFNLELNEGLESSFATRRDADPFDQACDHLLVEDKRTGEVVGTYRLQTGISAAQRLGYYSAQEFDFAPLDPFRHQIIECGRACVHSDHRNLQVLSLLWRGIAEYTREHQARYLVGCSSLTSQDPAVGLAAYEVLARDYLVAPEFRTHPVPSCACTTTQTNTDPVKLPKLLRAYLSLGAKICGPPAIDREFKTIDFLTWLDIDELPDIARRLVD